MATGKPGADSASIVTTQQQGQNLIQLSTQLFNQPPVFWGRYFTSSSTTGVEYSHRKENDILRRNGIRVCPVARQTKHVNGSRDQGAADARANAEDLVNTFGAAYLACSGWIVLSVPRCRKRPQPLARLLPRLGDNHLDPQRRSHVRGRAHSSLRLCHAKRHDDLASHRRRRRARRRLSWRLGRALAQRRRVRSSALE